MPFKIQHHKITAFSLVEISIILLIIGIIIAGITQGKKLLGNSSLRTAQTLTQTSPVNEMSDLVAWYESSLDSSFKEAEEKDGVVISTWHDNNLRAETKNHAIAPSPSNQPKFSEKAINNSLPAIRFDGADDFLTFDGKGLINNSYTIFVVEQRRSADNSMPFLGGTDNTPNQNLLLGYSGNNIIFSQADSGLNFVAGAFTSPTPSIHIFALSATTGRKYWHNTSGSPDAVNAGLTTPLTSFNEAAIGRYLTNYFNGDIAEIIIFSRVLKTEERGLVWEYLQKKYRITAR